MSGALRADLKYFPTLFLSVFSGFVGYSVAQAYQKNKTMPLVVATAVTTIAGVILAKHDERMGKFYHDHSLSFNCGITVFMCLTTLGNAWLRRSQTSAHKQDCSDKETDGKRSDDESDYQATIATDRERAAKKAASENKLYVAALLAGIISGSVFDQYYYR